MRINFRKLKKKTLFKKYVSHCIKVERTLQPRHNYLYTYKQDEVVPVKYDSESAATRWLFCKQHSVREKINEKPPDRTLFISGVPPYCDEDCLKRLFTPFGTVVSVFVHQKPTAGLPSVEPYILFTKHQKIKGYKVAYVVFENSSSLCRFLKIKSSEPLILFPEGHESVTGMQKWCREYNERIVDPTALRQEIDSFMAQYDAEQSAAQQKTGDEDDEGWITVTKRGRNPGFARKASVGKKIMEKEKQKRSKKELLNFYRFQIRESKMNHLANLRKKFEDDKKKIQSIKQCRRFKPF